MFVTRVLCTPADKALLRKEYLDQAFSFFDPSMVSHRTYIAVFEDATIVGLVALNESSLRMPGALGVGFIQTHEGHRNRGVAKCLVEGLFAYAASCGKPIANTEYEPDGKRWLEPLMRDASQRYPQVALYER